MDKDSLDTGVGVVKILLVIGGAFGSFVLGIVSATWAVANKTKGFDQRIGALEALNSGQDAKCVRFKGQCRAETTLIIMEAVSRLNDSWGPEIAGSRQQRIDQAATLNEIKENIVRLHERIDNIHEGRGK